MHSLDTLNPEQRKAALHLQGPLLILAGAGSGKTRVIAHRIAYLIAEGHARPDEVLAVTFTNKAAEEMRSRVETLLARDLTGAWISTFHALCARLLRREAPAIGLSRDFVIYDSSDQIALVKLALRELRIDDSALQPRMALSRISRAKNAMAGPESFQAAGWSPRAEQLAKIYARYQQGLADSSALDFDDLLLRTVELLERADHVRARYAEQFRFIMVDEYQDTNRPQYLLIQRLSERHRNLCVVGDPDQSIYGWRGADLRNIMDFERDFPEAAVVRLERNYRSTQIILDAASSVISRNRNRQGTRLWTERLGGDKVLYFRGADEIEEADYITRVARTGLGEDADTVVAVLYRTNAQSRVIEDALRRAGLAYRIVGGVRFYERKEIKDALAYLKLLINPHDDVSLRRVLNVPARGIGKGVMDALERMPVEDPGRGTALPPDGRAPSPGPRSLWIRLNRAVDAGPLAPRAVASLRAFRDLMAGLTEIAGREPLSTTLGKVLDQSGYLQDLREERSEDAQGRLDNLMELVSAAREHETRDAESSLSSFVDRLSLLSETDEEQGAREARVWLMTLHSAKGLEFPTVVIAGLEEGLFPHARASDDGADLDEERRLCYVGMTRARTRLILTGAARRRVFGEYPATRPSRFIDEVPVELLAVVEPLFPRSRQPGLPPYESRANPYGRLGRERAPDTAPFAYEDEDQSPATLRPGARVRHPQFGVGTVISVEELSDDLKLVVRFAIGSKTLRAKYAKLELA